MVLPLLNVSAVRLFCMLQLKLALRYDSWKSTNSKVFQIYQEVDLPRWLKHSITNTLTLAFYSKDNSAGEWWWGYPKTRCSSESERLRHQQGHVDAGEKAVCCVLQISQLTAYLLDASSTGSFFAVIQTNKSSHLLSASCLTAVFPRQPC